MNDPLGSVVVPAHLDFTSMNPPGQPYQMMADLSLSSLDDPTSLSYQPGNQQPVSLNQVYGNYGSQTIPYEHQAAYGINQAPTTNYATPIGGLVRPYAQPAFATSASAMPTPPPSSPTPMAKKPLVELLREERDRTVSEMQRLFDQRLELVQRTERERQLALEREYRQQLHKVQQDLDSMLQQQEAVLRLKGNVERDIQAELLRVRAELGRERDVHRQEKEALERTISELRVQLEELKGKLAKQPPANASRSALIREYEGKIAQLERQHDQKISGLVKQFQREKEAAIQIMRTKLKAEINLLVPRIRQQCKQSYQDALSRHRDQLRSELESQHQSQLQRLQRDHAVEIKVIQRQSREQQEQERQELARRLRQKYELRLAEVKNEFERRLIEKSRQQRRSRYGIDDEDASDDSFDL